MIVDPDFLDHWRTGMVADLLADQMAPVYILRLWGHCQDRRSDAFVMPTRGLKAQCKYPGDADAFEAALIEAGFIKRDGETIHVIGWSDKNASLIAAWSNGGKGGRPKKTETKPTGLPQETHGEPDANPDGTLAYPIREEKSGVIHPHTPKGVKTAAVGLKAWLDSIKAAGDKPIPEGDAVFAYADEVGIPEDFLRLAWLEFRHRYTQPDAKRYRDWRSVFRKAVRGNWLKLWFLDPASGAYGLTTVGLQAQRSNADRRAA